MPVPVQRAEQSKVTKGRCAEDARVNKAGTGTRYLGDSGAWRSQQLSKHAKGSPRQLYIISQLIALSTSIFMYLQSQRLARCEVSSVSSDQIPLLPKAELEDIAVSSHV
jgi:hypothetical protein